MSNAANGRVSGRAAESRVVQIERIDINGEQGDAAMFALRDGPVALQPLLHVGQREQHRQTVIANGNARGLMRAAQRVASQLRVDPQPVARVAMMPCEMRYPALAVE